MSGTTHVMILCCLVALVAGAPGEVSAQDGAGAAHAPALQAGAQLRQAREDVQEAQALQRALQRPARTAKQRRALDAELSRVLDARVRAARAALAEARRTVRCDSPSYQMQRAQQRADELTRLQVLRDANHARTTRRDPAARGRIVQQLLALSQEQHRRTTRRMWAERAHRRFMLRLPSEPEAVQLRALDRRLERVARLCREDRQRLTFMVRHADVQLARLLRRSLVDQESRLNAHLASRLLFTTPGWGGGYTREIARMVALEHHTRIFLIERKYPPSLESIGRQRRMVGKLHLELCKAPKMRGCADTPLRSVGPRRQGR